MSIDMSNVDDVDIISGPGHSSEVENYGYTSTANMWARCESIKLSWSKQREPNSSSDVIIHPRR